MGYLQYLEYSRFSRGTIGMFEIKFEFVNKKITDEVLTLFSWFIFFFTQSLAIRIHFCHHSFTAWRRWRSPLCLLWKVHWVSSRPTSSIFTVHTKEKAAGSKLGKRTVSGPSGSPWWETKTCTMAAVCTVWTGQLKNSSIGTKMSLYLIYVARGRAPDANPAVIVWFILYCILWAP